MRKAIEQRRADKTDDKPEPDLDDDSFESFTLRKEFLMKKHKKEKNEFKAQAQQNKGTKSPTTTQVNNDIYVKSLKNKYSRSLDSESNNFDENKKISNLIEDETPNFNNQNLRNFSEERKKKFNNFMEKNLSEELDLIPSLNDFINKNDNANLSSNINGLDSENDIDKIIENSEKINRDFMNNLNNKNLNDDSSNNIKQLMGILKLRESKLSPKEFEKYFQNTIDSREEKLDQWITEEDLKLIEDCDNKLNSGVKERIEREDYLGYGYNTRKWVDHIEKTIISNPYDFNIYSNLVENETQYYIPVESLMDHLNELSTFDNLNVEVLERKDEYVLIKREFTKKYKYSLEKLMNLNFEEFNTSHENKINEFIKNIDYNALFLSNYLSEVSLNLANKKDNFSTEKILTSISKIIDIIEKKNSNISSSDTDIRYNIEFKIGNFLSLLNKIYLSNDTKLNELNLNFQKISDYLKKVNTNDSIKGKNSVENIVENYDEFMKDLTPEETEMLFKFIEYNNYVNNSKDLKKIDLVKILENLLIQTSSKVLNKNEFVIVKYLMKVPIFASKANSDIIVKNLNLTKNILWNSFVSNNIKSVLKFSSSSEQNIEEMINEFINYHKLFTQESRRHNKTNVNNSSTNLIEFSKEKIIELKEKLNMLFLDLKNLSKFFYLYIKIFYFHYKI